jgi:hypothetical protein
MSRDFGRALKLAPRTGQDRRAHSEVVVGRRYVEHGFLDAALRIFSRRTALVTEQDWSGLMDGLLERGRVTDAVAVCQMGNLPFPREQLLELGDRAVKRRDIESALHYYELVGADRERWSAFVDVLVRLPGRELQAMEVTQRHLLEDPSSLPLAASA